MAGKGSRKKKLLKKRDRNKNSKEKRLEDSPSPASEPSQPSIEDSDMEKVEGDLPADDIKTEENLENKVSQTLRPRSN